MANDYSIFFQRQQPDYSVFFPKISEAEANRTLTPEEQAMVVPEFGAGLSRRMAEYNGLSPTEAAGKYRAGWADTISNVYDTVSDSRKLGSAVRGAAKAGAHAVTHPAETVQRVGNYYTENPDAAATDAAFALFPGQQGVKWAGQAVRPSTAMPRGSIRAGDELIGTGGGRMNASKKSEVALPPEEVVPSFSGFHARLGEKGIRLNKKLHPKTYAAFEEFTNFVRPKPMQENVRPATMLDLHEVRQLASNAAKDVHPGTNRRTADAMLANELLKTIDEVIKKHPEGPEFLRGKSELARGLKSEGILGIIEDAKNTTQWDRGDHAGAIRNKVNAYIKKNKKFLTKQDIRDLRRIKRYGPMEALAGQGSMSPMALTLGRGIEFMTGLPYTSLYFAGKFARDAINTRKPAQLERMAERIRAGE